MCSLFQTQMNAMLNVQTMFGGAASAPSKERRKRRRGEIANPSNTLDALVARKADDEQPFEKRYLSEHEAIEGPDDEIEMKKMEMDPDVSTRTCSTCGYQGKWVSEMIRHKRVHTSERPFKCRYCSRTSKWKADLIRHVAKTHGIRVVSKYSRSKVFDASGVDQPIDVKQRAMTYRCALCAFDDERVSIVNRHVAAAHFTSPCVCRCGANFDDIPSALNHAAAGVCRHNDIVFNVMPNYDKSSPLSPCQSETSSDSGIHTDRDDDLPSPIAAASTIIQPVPILTPLVSLYLASILQSTISLTPTVVNYSAPESQEEDIDVVM
ncbi:unnamed protein product [Caenorhabditis bovis]|uniref:C2H2-type domain-containing protein n=1 Tax=Caenorhabditis bovis TaxID=2654633 RepID=A0A8S1F062_9PELO|nr:unnamed protein product [Caenorhabditis bovis]